MRNEKIQKLSSDEVQKEILKVLIGNNKKLKSISNSLTFIVVLIIVSVVVTFFSLSLN